MQGYYIYALRPGALFLVNLVMDLLWFWLTALLSGIAPQWWRLGAASLLGAAIALLPWAAPWGWAAATGPAVLAGSVALLLVAFGRKPWRQMLRLTGFFFAIPGATWGVVNLLTTPRGAGHWSGLPVQASYAPGLVSVGFLLVVAGAHLIVRSLQERRRITQFRCWLRIGLGDERIDLPALVDTGNGLTLPGGGRPVAVVEAAALSQLLPPSLTAAGLAHGLEQVPPEWRPRLHLVPYSALGNTGSYLLAVRPDSLATSGEPGGPWTAVQGVVGLANQPLDPEGRFRAIVPPALLPHEAAGPSISEGGESA